jgi:hypothetical protein
LNMDQYRHPKVQLGQSTSFVATMFHQQNYNQSYTTVCFRVLAKLNLLMVVRF